MNNTMLTGVKTRILASAIVVLLVVSGYGASNPCYTCQPIIPSPAPLPVTPPPLEPPEEPQCQYHLMELGLSLGTWGKLEGFDSVTWDLGLRSKGSPLVGHYYDLAIGISFVAMEETILGFNVKIGSLPGLPSTPFDVFRLAVFPKTLNKDVNRSEIRIQVGTPRASFGAGEILAYGGFETITHLRRGSGDLRTNSLFFGGDLRGCFKPFSFNIQIEVQGSLVDVDCVESYDWSIIARLKIWAFKLGIF